MHYESLLGSVFKNYMTVYRQKLKFFPHLLHIVHTHGSNHLLLPSSLAGSLMPSHKLFLEHTKLNFAP